MPAILHRLTVASPVPSRPHMIPTIGRDVRKRQVDSFSRPSASLPVSPRPGRPSVGRRESGGKVAALPPPCGPWGSPRAAARCSPERGQWCAGSGPAWDARRIPEDRQGSLELISTSGQRFCFHASSQDCRGTLPPHCDHRRPELRAERGPGAPPVTPVVGPAEVIAIASTSCQVRVHQRASEDLAQGSHQAVPLALKTSGSGPGAAHRRYPRQGTHRARCGFWE
jgi:hypothetical protein